MKLEGFRWKHNIKSLLVPLSSFYSLPWCHQRSLSLDLLTLCSLSIINIRRLSYDHHCLVSSPLLVPLLSSHPSRAHCLNVIWQTKRPFIWSRNKTQHPPFTLGPSNTPTNAATFSKSACLNSFVLLAGAENFSPQIKEGITANMAGIPTLMHIRCVCTRM